MTRVVESSSGASADPRAAEYVRTKLDSDFHKLTAALGKLQQDGELDPITEQRAMAAANRVIVAAGRAHTDLLSRPERDHVERLLSSARYRSLSMHHDTAVENEAKTSWGVMAALTTEDGTVGPILREGGKAEPAFLKDLAHGRPTQSIAFDELSPPQKLELLQSQSKGRDFFSERRIPGVIFRDGVAVSGGLQKKVEYMGPTNVDTVNGIEFHVRQPGQASQSLQTAMAAANKLKVNVVSRHQHIPARIPASIMRGNFPASIMKGDDVDRFRLVDFYRRTNTTAELKSLLDGYRLSPVEQGDVTYFDFLQSSGLIQMNEHLSDVAANRRSWIEHDDLKMAAVGFRTGEMYGDPKMFGFEIRTISPARTEEWGTFANAVQKGVLTGSYGLPRSSVAEWHAANVSGGIQGQNAALEKLHYNRPIVYLLADAPAALKPSLTPEVTERLKANAPKFYGLKMLVHDWSRDPVLAGKPALQAHVVAAQQKGLAALGGASVDENRMHAIVKTFAAESGLYEAFATSMGMDEAMVQPH
jgi:hypothetical protein